jgi:hypothetical protein
MIRDDPRGFGWHGWAFHQGSLGGPSTGLTFHDFSCISPDLVLLWWLCLHVFAFFECYFMIFFSRTKPEKNRKKYTILNTTVVCKTLDSQTVGNFWVKQKPTPVDLTIEIIPRPKNIEDDVIFPDFFGQTQI